MSFDYSDAFALLEEKFGGKIIRSPSKEVIDTLKIICKDEEMDSEVYEDERIGNCINKLKWETRQFKYEGSEDIVDYCGIKYRSFRGLKFGQLEDEQKDEVFWAMEIFSSNITEYSIRAQVIRSFPIGELKLFTSGANYKSKTGRKRNTDNTYVRYCEKGKGRKYIGKKYKAAFLFIMRLRDKIKRELASFRGLLESGIRVLKDLLGVNLDLERISESMAAKKLYSDEYKKKRKTQINETTGEKGRAEKSVTIGSDYVASRFESICINRIEGMNIPHLCEEPLDLNPGHRGPYRVDVTYEQLLSYGQESTVRVELFGMVDNDKYYGTAYDKISNYSRCGIEIGKNLIVFVSGSTAVNACVINQVLVMSLFGFIPVDYVVV